MPYRTSAKPSAETIEICPQPALTRLATLLAAVLLMGPGALMLWTAASDGVAVMDVLQRAIGFLMGLVFLHAYLRSANAVRLVYDEHDVTILWLRGRRTLRTERLKRADLVDVGIDDTPSSGGTIYRLALGTKLGDIVFADTHTNDLPFYESRARELHRALGLPLRG